MEEKKKNNNIIIVILVLIIIVALGVIAYMFINQKDDNKKNTTNNKENNNTVVEKGKSEIEIMNINDQLVKKLHNYIPLAGTDTKNAYQYDKVNYQSLDNKTILSNANRFIINHEDCNYNNDATTENCVNGSFYISKFSKEEMEEKIKLIFGENVFIKHESFNSFGPSRGAEFYNNVYYDLQGSDAGNISLIVKIEKAEKKGDNILYIYDKYIELKNTNDTNFDYYIDYNDLSKYSDKDKIIITSLQDSMVNYKHTFKKDSIGNYHWISSEKI